MWEIPLIFLMISLIPETIILTMLAFALAKIEYRFFPIITIGTLQAVTVYFVRKLPIYFGIHTIIAILALAVMIYLYRRTYFFRILTYSFFSMLILLLLEFSFFYGINAIWPEYMELAKGNSLLWALSSYPHIIAMLIVALVINKKNNTRRERWKF